jgi:hypothetical protein
VYEALGLTIGHVDLSGAILTIRDSKFISAVVVMRRASTMPAPCAHKFSSRDEYRDPEARMYPGLESEDEMLVAGQKLATAAVSVGHVSNIGSRRAISNACLKFGPR